MIVLGMAGLILLIVVYFANLKVAGWQGVGKEFFSQWTNTRTFLSTGYSPYKQEALFQVEQEAFLTGLTFTGKFSTNAEPLYSLLAFIPFVVIQSFNYAFAAWLVVNEALLIFTFWLLYRLTSWKGGTVLFAFVCLSIVGWKSLLAVLFSGSSSILVLFAVSGVLYALKHGMNELAGVLLAIASIKVETLWLPILFVLIYCYVKQNKKALLWFFVSIFLVSASLMLLDPAWIKDYVIAFLTQLLNYPHNLFKATSIPQLFNESYFSFFSPALETIFLTFGVRLGNVFILIITGLMLFEWTSMGKRDDKGILWLFCFTVLVSSWLGVNNKTELFIFFVPILLLFISLLHDRWKGKGKIMYWIVPAFLLVLNWFSFSVDSPVLILMYGLYPFVFLILLYWIRWWALSKNFLVYEWNSK
jgi:hypothetical protein